MARERKSAAKTAANRSNAVRSTGPRTSSGKAVAKLNAVAHGLRAAAPVLPGERAADWDAYRVGVEAQLAPVGVLETELADRVALLTWRLRRVGVYETMATVAEQDAAALAARAGAGEPDPRGWRPARARADLSQARAAAADGAAERDGYQLLLTAPPAHPIAGREACRLLRSAHAYTPPGTDEGDDDEDDEFDVFGAADDFAELAANDARERRFLAAAGVPAEWRAEPEQWGGWTAGAVAAGVAVVAQDAGMTAQALLERAVRAAGTTAATEGRRAAALETQLAEFEAAAARAEAAARARTVLPAAPVLDNVMRYEGHLSRQLTQTLQLLERLQAARAGTPPVPAAALNVTVDVGVPPGTAG